jgi:hypothetical protein
MPLRLSARPAPLLGAYQRLTAAYPGLTVRPGEPEGPTNADLAADEGLLRAAIADEAARGRAAYGEELRPDVAATFCLHRVVWPTALVVTLPWLLERRVPLLGPADVALNGDRSRATVRIPAYACLPDDPAAVPPARPVPDEEALRAEVRRTLAGQLAPLLAAFRPYLRRGPHTLWALAADDVVEGLWYAGSLLGREAEAVAALEALLPGGTAPLAAPAAFRPAPSAAGGARYTRTRTSCCLYYTVSGVDPCFTCPRTRQAV